VADPVSWKVVERGWKVTDASGNQLGYVDEILGDPEADIFGGLNVSHGSLSGTEYVPSERVAEIREGQVVIAQ
jgi:uncharacterized protein YrrD